MMKAAMATAFMATLWVPAQLQDVLSLDQAIAEALNKNGNIQVARMRTEMAENNASYGQAGLLPTLSGTGSVNYGVNDTKIQITGNPDAIETDGASSTTYNAALQLNYTVFSGFSNKFNYDKLVISAAQTAQQSQTAIEDIVLQVASAYYNLLRANENLEVLKENLSISKERLERANAQRAYAGGSSMAVLNAEVDRNQDSVEFINATQARDQARIMLNQVTGRSLDTETVVSIEDEAPELSDFGTLLSKMEQQNAQQINARLQEQASLLDYKIARSAYSPRLNLSGSYAYNRNQAEGSFLELNEQLGYNVALSLSIPIYQGGVRRTAQKNTAIALEASQLESIELKRSLEAQLMVAYQDYLNAKKALDLEQSSVVTAEQNFALSEERFKLGQLTNTDFRTAQLNLLLTKNNLNNLRYNVHLAALEVLRISGMLLSEN